MTSFHQTKLYLLWLSKNQLVGCLVWPPCVADVDIIFLSCGFLYLSIFLFLAYSQLSQIGCLPYFHTCVALVRIQDAGLKRATCGSLKIQDAKKLPKIRHLHAIAQLCRAISSQLRHISTIGKKIVKQQHLPDMSLQYGEFRPTSGWKHFLSLGHPS